MQQEDAELKALLGSDVYARAKAIVEAAGPDYDWSKLIDAVDEFAPKLAGLQAIPFEELERFSDEAIQLLKLSAQGLEKSKIDEAAQLRKLRR